MAFDKEIAAMTVFMEASGEPPEGRRAVAWVLENRLASGNFGQTLAEVCLEPFQISSWNTTDPNRKRLARTSDGDPILADCIAAVAEAMEGISDPTLGATNYYAASMSVPPDWASRMTFTVQIGNHLFYKPSSSQ